MSLNAEIETLRLRVAECETRIASLMWTLGVVRRGVDWKEESPILRLIDKTLDHETSRGAPLGSNVTRMSARR
jgi:hypothetical protein